MKNSGRNLKRRLYGLSIWGNRLSRIKHYRGHGVHSPYVYSFVRNVLMHRTLAEDSDHSLYNTLIDAGVAKRRAVELQKMVQFYNISSFSIDDNACRSELNILTNHYSTEQLDIAWQNSVKCGTTLVILAPYQNRARRQKCSELINLQRSTTVDYRGYLIFFKNHLPKLHYKL